MRLGNGWGGLAKQQKAPRMRKGDKERETRQDTLAWQLLRGLTRRQRQKKDHRDSRRLRRRPRNCRQEEWHDGMGSGGQPLYVRS